MSRIPRDNMQNSSFFHVMVQGINQEYIFNDKENMEKYIELLEKNREQLQVIAYCIMNNHAHMLVESNNIRNLENWMRKTNTSYAIYYNKRKNRVGYVFRDRYKVQLIKNVKHLYQCIEYIHDNPIKAGICRKQEEYDFSSYQKMYKGNKLNITKKMEYMLKRDIQSLEKQESKNNKFEFMEEAIENKDETCKTLIYKFLVRRNLKLEDLRKERIELKEIVQILKNENNISYRIMEKYLKVGRETLRKINKE